MVKIAFHDNYLCERGTTVAIYDYAYYNKYYLGNESIIMYANNSKSNVPEVIEKFNKEFTLCPYNNWQQEADNILKQENCDILYMIKAGDWDGKMASNTTCKTVVHCVFNIQYQHGDVYATISPRVNGTSGKYPVVSHMINLPNNDYNMRKELNIPNDAVVFGRHGGIDQFNIKYVHSTVDKITDENTNIYFIFVNTEKFCKDKNNIIHLDKIIDLEKKVEFINSCDAMIHAREMGETFGCSVGEFSLRNKPVITCSNGNDLVHIDILKDKCFKYDDKESLMNVFNTIINDIQNIKNKDWNAYNDYLPEKIMDKFNEIFIKPCIYDTLWKPGHLHGMWLTNNKNRQNNKKINQAVDIGSGTGWFVNYIVDEFNFERVIGIEPSESAINIAKKINPKNYETNKVSYHVGLAEDQLSKVKLDRNIPTLFTTSIVLSHIEDDSVINILKEMNKIASKDSVFIFNENYDNDFHQNLWHCRTREWWKTQLPEWKLIFDERPRPDLNNKWKQGILGIKQTYMNTNIAEMNTNIAEMNTNIAEFRGFKFKYFTDDLLGRNSVGSNKSWEDHILNFVTKYNEKFDLRNIIDVGANFGYHTVFFSKLASHVYSFEPQIQNYQLLQNNIKLNNLDNVTIYNNACGDETNYVKLPIMPSNIKNWNMGDFTANIIINGLNYSSTKSIVLDNMNYENIDLIKIDVQGWEKKVLQGLNNLISTNKPTLIVEFEEHQLKKANCSSKELFDYIRNLNYTIFYLEFEYPCDHICVHNDRIDEFKNKFEKYIFPHTENNNLNNNYLNNVKYKIYIE